MYKKNSKPTYKKTSVSDKHIATIAKKVNLKVAENKVKTAELALNPTDTFTYAVNLTANLAQGTSNSQVIGERIMLKNIHLKVRLTANPQASQDTVMRLLVVKSNARWTNTSTSFAATNVFTTTAHAGIRMVDFSKVQLLSDKVFTIKHNFPAQQPSTIVDTIISLNRSIIYEDNTLTYGKTGNYYLIVTGQDYSVASIGNVYINWLLNYTDE